MGLVMSMGADCFAAESHNTHSPRPTNTRLQTIKNFVVKHKLAIGTSLGVAAIAGTALYTGAAIPLWQTNYGPNWAVRAGTILALGRSEKIREQVANQVVNSQSSNWCMIKAPHDHNTRFIGFRPSLPGVQIYKTRIHCNTGLVAPA